MIKFMYLKYYGYNYPYAKVQQFLQMTKLQVIFFAKYMLSWLIKNHKLSEKLKVFRLKIR